MFCEDPAIEDSHSPLTTSKLHKLWFVTASKFCQDPLSTSSCGDTLLLSDLTERARVPPDYQLLLSSSATMVSSSSLDAPAAVESSGGLILALLTMLWAPTGTPLHTRNPCQAVFSWAHLCTFVKNFHPALLSALSLSAAGFSEVLSSCILHLWALCHVINNALRTTLWCSCTVNSSRLRRRLIAQAQHLATRVRRGSKIIHISITETGSLIEFG